MIGSLYTAASAVIAEQRRMDGVANDVANVNTPGYRSQRTDFSDTLGGGVVARQSGESSAQGAIEQTDQPFDLAIEGDGWFQVRRPNGQLALTRDGSFRPDSYGRLATAGGDRLEPPVALPPGTDPATVSVGPGGSISAAGTTIGQVSVVTVPAPAGLLAVGDGLRSPTAASGSPQPATGATIRQGALESSNVDLADTTVASIDAEASTKAAAAAFRAQDAMLAALLGLT
jgi:flagellar basal-body rod protein FlgG